MKLLRFLLTIITFVIAIYVSAAMMNGILDGAFKGWEASIQIGVPFLLISAASEEFFKFLPLRNADFRKGLVLVLALATAESLFYSLMAERSATFAGWSLAMIWGIWFWLTFLQRFILNGHVLFYLASTAIGQVERADARLARFGANYGIAGLSVGWTGHFFWNLGAMYDIDVFGQPLFPIAAFALALLGFVSLWAHRLFDDMK